MIFRRYSAVRILLAATLWLAGRVEGRSSRPGLLTVHLRDACLGFFVPQPGGSVTYWFRDSPDSKPASALLPGPMTLGSGLDLTNLCWLTWGEQCPLAVVRVQ